jgi:hypothetical protein
VVCSRRVGITKSGRNPIRPVAALREMRRKQHPEPVTGTDDALTRHIEHTGQLRVLGEPRIGGPVRIAVPGHSPLGLAFFSLP